MAQRKDKPQPWPLHLATFDAAAWPASPDEVVESCRCPSCVERWGPPGPAIDTVADARRRWRAARQAALVRGTREFKAEVMAAIYEGTYRHRYKESEK